MPGFTTHYILGMKAYNDMPTGNLKLIIAKYRWLYQLGLQGPDIFFYNLPILRYRDHRNVGSYMHEHHVNDFFRCCFAHLAEISSKQQREQGIAYMCGFLCHYVGDSICHPYVYGRINYNATTPDIYQHGLHARLENDLDALLLKKYKKKKPSQFNQAATICLNAMETQFISRFLASCINEVFYPINTNDLSPAAHLHTRHEKNRYQVTASMIHRSILAIRFGCRTLSDPTSSKKKKLARMEALLFKSPVASSKLVTDTVEDPVWSLNLRHETWCNPWDKRIASQASFPDLFRQCLAKMDTLYYMINKMLGADRTLPVSDMERFFAEIGDASYHSGLPCSYSIT